MQIYERQTLSTVAEVERRESPTFYAEMEQRLEETPHKKGSRPNGSDLFLCGVNQENTNACRSEESPVDFR